MSFSAHFRTVWPVVRRAAAAPTARPSEPWSVEIHDPKIGPVRLTGRLRAVPGSSELLILVHGLGGSAESTYILQTARLAEDLGLSTLRLNLRGADRCGEDFYHAGLSRDLRCVLGSPELAGYDSFLVFGFSLGGHVSLRFATEATDPRLRAVAAACAPLELDHSVRTLDQPSHWLYRRYVLAGLCQMYAEVAARRDLPLTVAEARRIRTIREWDRQTVVPRFDFDSPEDYYRQAGVGRRLDRLRVPALLVASEEDPMIPQEAVHRGLNGMPELLSLRWARRGGHLYFPAGLDLAEDGPPGLAGQVISWLGRQ